MSRLKAGAVLPMMSRLKAATYKDPRRRGL
jgi:hypothetical protein